MKNFKKKGSTISRKIAIYGYEIIGDGCWFPCKNCSIIGWCTPWNCGNACNSCTCEWGD